MKHKIIGYMLPYVTVTAGIFGLHSAWAAALFYHAGIVGFTLFSKNRPSVKSLFKSDGFRIPAGLAALGAVGGVALYALWPYLAAAGHTRAYTESLGLNERTWPWFMAYFALMNGWLEEYYWRGLLGSLSHGLTLNDVLFSGYHLIILAGGIGSLWLAAVFFIISLAAWAWRQVNRVQKGLLPSTACHVIADISFIIVIYFRTR